MEKQNNTTWPSFVGILTIIFITLKLCGVINWTWLWVLSPIWIVFALAISIGIVAVIFKRL